MTQISIHELAFTLPTGTTAEELPQLLRNLFSLEDIDPDSIKLPKGRQGYLEAYALKSPHGAELLSVYSRGTGAQRGTTHIVVHGAAWESGDINPATLAVKIITFRGYGHSAGYGWGVSAHIALDDHGGLLPWSEIKEACAFDQYQNRITTRLCKPSRDKQTGEMKQNPPVLMIEQGETVNLGKRTSATSLCMYTRRGPVRVELRIKDPGIVTDLLKRLATGEPLHPIATGLVRHNLSFVEPGDGRKDRRPVCPWWLAFLQDALPTRLGRVRSEENRSPFYAPPDPYELIEKDYRRHLNGKNREAAEFIIRKLAAELGQQI
jgi:hypothetical protein